MKETPPPTYACKTCEDRGCVVCAISALEPSAEAIRSVYMNFVDRTPVCGWLAMLITLQSIARDKKDPRSFRVNMFVECVVFEARCRVESGRLPNTACSHTSAS